MEVDSPVKEQQEHNRFIEDSRDLWDEFQRLAIKERKVFQLKPNEKHFEQRVIVYLLLLINGN